MDEQRRAARARARRGHVRVVSRSARTRVQHGRVAGSRTRSASRRRSESDDEARESVGTARPAHAARHDLRRGHRLRRSARTARTSRSSATRPTTTRTRPGDLVVRGLATGDRGPPRQRGHVGVEPDRPPARRHAPHGFGAGRGVQLFDPGSGHAARARPLGRRVRRSSPGARTTTTWPCCAPAPTTASRRTRTSSSSGGTWPRRRAAALVLDPSRGSGLPRRRRGWPRPRSRSWSADGRSLFFGLRSRERHGGTEPGGLVVRRGRPGRRPRTRTRTRRSPRRWRCGSTDDLRIIPMQRAQEARDLARTLLAVWHVDDGAFVRLGTDLMAHDRAAGGGALGDRARREARTRDDVMFGRSWQDVYRIDARSGERTRLLEKVRYVYRRSPEGRWVLYFQGEDWWSLEVGAGETANLTGALGGDFADGDVRLPGGAASARGLPASGLDRRRRGGAAPRPLRRVGRAPGRLGREPAHGRRGPSGSRTAW